MDQDEKNSEKQVSKNVLSNPRRLDPVSADKRQAFWVLVSDNLKLANKNATFARMLQCISLTNQIFQGGYNISQIKIRDN